ncbi:ABC transporter ATP-binding protein [Paenibacillus sp. FSL R7-0273]|uniref:ABC transporter ATP-binding protein n=1 Tax=Paenibacillus sp. FSL R7-0273 TaxID=1536772 RepID=UPI0004F6A95F|nr:ABC transporter ATP-binding protein [Paenibacillus sp. FSL R7-0273]AIQ48790.1 ABC transporter ATP-binding protein [Paenibacillus sp. FSL R7-0273]OMF93871.1 ABC transporter ATP-binding protein [Paenibacillus sp. FSL R7-0273]
MKVLHNITAGKPQQLLKPVLFSLLSNLAAVFPFALVIEAVRLIFEPYLTPGAVLQIERLWWLCAGLAGAALLIFVSEIPAYRAAYRGAYNVAAEGRAGLAEHLRRLPLGVLYRRDPGDLANMMMGDFTLVETGISHLLPQLAGAFVLPVFALAGMLLLDWRMALSMFAALPVALLLIFLTSRLQRRLGSSHMQAKLNAANRLQEYLNGIRVMKAYNLTGERFARLDTAFRKLMKESIRLEGILGPVVLTAVGLLRAGLPLLVYTGVQLLLGGSLGVLQFAVFLIVGTRIYDPLTSALTNYAEFRYNEQAGERIVRLLQEPVMTGDTGPLPTDSTITFKDVSFSYGETRVLNNLSFVLPQGALTAIVGPSGSGKSTVLRLISRFYDPDEGSVYLGGRKLSGIDPEHLLKAVSVVFQDVYLFQDTIANNIAFGRPGASREEVIRAATTARCHEFISRLPQGYDTPVGEGGSTLSGGEKQRLSIARAILKDAPIVLLDEATASLDPQNEAEIQKAVHSLIQGRTVIVIAHRLKTIRGADNIIVLEQGGMAQQGTHEELLAADGLYARLWRLQQDTAGFRISS